MPENICISGGAQGADSLFALCAQDAGHKIRHLSFPKHGVHSKIGEKFDVVSGNEEKWDFYINRINLYLQRSISGMSEYSRNLLRRNMAIAFESESLYAVTYLDKGVVGGGTAWGFYMAHDRNIPVYLFDQVTNQWFTNVGGSFGEILVPISHNKIPRPERKYGAIGSRQLTQNGIEATKSLYKD